MEDPEKLQPLTKKERVFVGEYARTENGTQAALKAYDTEKPSVAASIAAENLEKPHIVAAVEKKRKSLKQALIDKGIDEDYLAEKVGVLLEATTPDGDTDYGAVDKGLKHAATFHGVSSPEDSPRTQNIYNFVFTEEGRARISTVESEIKEALTKRPIHVQTN